MSDEKKVLREEAICTLNSFYDCSDRHFDRKCGLELFPKYSKSESTCQYRIICLTIPEQSKEREE